MSIAPRNTTLRRFNDAPKRCVRGHTECSYIVAGPCSLESECQECGLPFNWHESGCEAGAKSCGFFVWEGF